jgi:hypothetical protein
MAPLRRLIGITLLCITAHPKKRTISTHTASEYLSCIRAPQFPSAGISSGEAAFQVVTHYYQALTEQGSPEQFREYAQRRLEEITRRYQSSQGLPVPIDLSEGQLSVDEELDFFACLALSNRQVLLRGQS